MRHRKPAQIVNSSLASAVTRPTHITRLSSPSEQVSALRGGDWFCNLQKTHPTLVQVVHGGDKFKIYPGRLNVVFQSLPTNSIDELLAVTDQSTILVVMLDLHFPITTPWDISGDDETVLSVLDDRESMLRNIERADVVTCSRIEWMSELYDLTHRLYFAPDLAPDDAGDTERFGEEFRIARHVGLANALRRQAVLE